MNFRKFAWIPFALAGCMTGGASGASDTASDAVSGDPAAESAQIDPVRAALQRGLDTLAGDGMVGALGELSDGSGRVAARSGVARLGSTAPVAFDSRFRMGSNTKTFVAVVMLQLVQEGKLGLDDTVDHWLPGVVSGNGNDGTKITVRNLLQHTTGIFDYTEALLAGLTLDGFQQLRFEHFEPEQLIAIAMAHEPKFAPGAGWSYSNTNYILAGMIIKKVTGQLWSASWLRCACRRRSRQAIGPICRRRTPRATRRSLPTARRSTSRWATTRSRTPRARSSPPRAT